MTQQFAGLSSSPFCLIAGLAPRLGQVATATPPSDAPEWTKRVAGKLDAFRTFMDTLRFPDSLGPAASAEPAAVPAAGPASQAVLRSNASYFEGAADLKPASTYPATPTAEMKALRYANSVAGSFAPYRLQWYVKGRPKVAPICEILDGVGVAWAD